MKHRHHMAKEHHKAEKRARGGKADWYAGGESNVAKEAEEKKHGGRVKKKHGGHVEGHKAKHRLDRPGRKRGGGVGADMKPLSSAARESQASGHKVEREPEGD